MVLVFFTSFAVMCHYRDKMDPKIWNLAFIVADAVFFFCWNYADFERGALEKGWMTFENISPFVCTMIPLTLIMNDKVKQAAYDTLAAFSVGLFVALMISPEHAYLYNFHTEANFMYTAEAACHLVAALFGIYLVLSKQVVPNFRAWCRTIVFIYSVIGFGVFLNYAFHKTYFGFNPYGSSSIYMIDIFATSEVTLVAYLAGVLVVLTLGLQCMYALMQALDKIKKHDEAVAERRAAALAEGAQVRKSDTGRGEENNGADFAEDGEAEDAREREKKEYYLFDLDGTLINSMPTFGAMIIRVAYELGIEYPEDIVRIATPLGYIGSAEYFIGLGAKGSVGEITDRMKEISGLDYENSIPLKEGAEEALRALYDRGASLNVLTASPHGMLDPCLKRLGVYDLFDNVWSSEDFARTKSDPEIYRMAAERMGAAVGDVVFVDDNKGALSTALEAGVRAVGIFDESSAELKDEIAAIAQRYIYSLTELL